MSRPADPASRRKQAVPAVKRRRKVGFVEDLVSEHRREGDLGGGDGPQVVAFEVIGVVGELGQVARRHHRLGPHQRGRADLLVQLAVVVEGEGGERPDQPGPRPR